MPKMPMADMPGNIKPIDHSARATAIPDDFGMGKSRAILKASELIIQGSEQLGKSIMKYNKVLRDKEDELAIQQAFNAYAKRQFKLKSRMTENPNDVLLFGEWAETDNKEWTEEEKQYTSRMSENALQRYQLAMEKQKYFDVKEQETISTMARTANLYNDQKSLIADYMNKGDFEGAIAILDNDQNGEKPLFSPQDYKRYKEVIIPAQQELREIKQAEIAKDFSIIERLQKVDEKGVYTEFTHIPLNDRLNLIRDLKGKQAQGDTDMYRDLVVSCYEGKPKYTMDNLKSMLKQNTINKATFIQLAGVLEQYERKLKAIATEQSQENILQAKVGAIFKGKPAYTSKERLDDDYAAGKLSDGEYDYHFGVLVKYEDAQEKQEKHTQKNTAYGVIGQIYTWDISMHPAENALLKKKAYELIKKNIKNEQIQVETLKEVEQYFADILAGKGVFDTVDGKEVYDWLFGTYKTDGKFNKPGTFAVGNSLAYDPFGWEKYDSQEFMAERFYILMDYAAKELKKGKTSGEVIELVMKKKNQISENDVKNIFKAIERRSSENVSGLIEAADKHVSSNEGK